MGRLPDPTRCHCLDAAFLADNAETGYVCRRINLYSFNRSGCGPHAVGDLRPLEGWS